MIKKSANFISWLFLPLFVPIYGLLLVLYLPVDAHSFIMNDSLYLLNPNAKLLLLILFFVFIVLAPGTSLLVMKKNKTIASLEMDKTEERKTPIILMTFYCLVLYLFLNYQDENALIPNIVKAMVLGGASASFFAYFITKKMKISLHGIGMGALFGFVYMFSLRLENAPIYLLILILILSGVVLSARLILNAHNLKEVNSGYVLGFFTQIVCVYFFG